MYKLVGIFKYVGLEFLSGSMMVTVKVDAKGRVVIPKNIRKATKLQTGSYVNVTVKGKSILIEPLEPVADKYRGIFKVERWPKDLDEFVNEVIKDWWMPRAT